MSRRSWRRALSHEGRNSEGLENWKTGHQDWETRLEDRGPGLEGQGRFERLQLGSLEPPAAAKSPRERGPEATDKSSFGAESHCRVVSPGTDADGEVPENGASPPSAWHLAASSLGKTRWRARQQSRDMAYRVLNQHHKATSRRLAGSRETTV